MVRTRFAPSPTGYLHIGGLRTALYSYLFAKKNGGQFLLRIEDTDRERFVADGTKNILDSLYWAGIVPDEGVLLKGSRVVQNGDCGPYVQSERLSIYQKYAQQLIDAGQAYYCFCTSERLEEVRKVQQLNKQPTGYDGHCRELDKNESAKRVAAGEKYVVRMKMPKIGETVFTDLIKGEVKFKNELVDDQVLLKSDGFPTYHLAVVVDDHEMKISHVIRGDEWVSSTPKHLQLYQYFGWTPPQFAHLPLLLNSDKSKLSKRQGDVAVSDYQNKGYLPEAVINFVAFLGWNPGDNREIFSLKELISEFDLVKVNKSGAVFNLEKLDWMNREYIKSLTSGELLSRSVPFLEAKGIKSKDKGVIEKAIMLERERVSTLAELPDVVKFVFKLPGYSPELLIWKKSSADEVKEILPKLKDYLDTFDIQKWNKTDLEIKVGEWIKTNGYNNGQVLWPLRVALSGQEKSPGPFEIAEVLGKDETLVRLNVAISKFNN